MPILAPVSTPEAPSGSRTSRCPAHKPNTPPLFLYYDESDPGPYAIPLNAPIEGGSQSTGDRRTLAIDVDRCVLYELGRAFPQTASWQADGGAIFNLLSNALRPATWTSTDAAGLSVFAGLVRYDEIGAGPARSRFFRPGLRPRDVLLIGAGRSLKVTAFIGAGPSASVLQGHQILRSQNEGAAILRAGASR